MAVDQLYADCLHELAEMKVERDALADRLEEAQDWEEVAHRFQEQRDAALQREQALAAHARRMKTIADEAYASYAACHEHECAAALTRLINAEAPTTNLARLKAQWQADALQRLKDRYNEHEGAVSLFEIIDDELPYWSRQAEGGDSHDD